MVRTPLIAEQIPAEYRWRVTLNTEVVPNGTGPHRELSSVYRCVECDRAVTTRNSRIRRSLRLRTFRCRCRGCRNRIPDGLRGRIAADQGTSYEVARRYGVSVWTVRKVKRDA